MGVLEKCTENVLFYENEKTLSHMARRFQGFEGFCDLLFTSRGETELL